MIEPGVRHVLDDHLAGIESLGCGLSRGLLNLRFDLHPLSTIYRLPIAACCAGGRRARKQAPETERLEEV